MPSFNYFEFRITIRLQKLKFQKYKNQNPLYLKFIRNGLNRKGVRIEVARSSILCRLQSAQEMTK